MLLQRQTLTPQKPFSHIHAIHPSEGYNTYALTLKKLGRKENLRLNEFSLGKLLLYITTSQTNTPIMEKCLPLERLCFTNPSRIWAWYSSVFFEAK
jgi:hypothetical protein